MRAAVEREAIALCSNSSVSGLLAFLEDWGTKIYLAGGRVREAALENSYSGDVDLVVKGPPNLNIILERHYSGKLVRGRLGGMKVIFDECKVDIVEWDLLLDKESKSLFCRFNAFNNCALVSMKNHKISFCDHRFFSSNYSRSLDINPIGFEWMSAGNRNRFFLKTLRLAITSHLYIANADSIAALLREAMDYNSAALTSLIDCMLGAGRIEEADRLKRIII